MAKAKPKPAMSNPQKAMHSRASYLYQAAAYFATVNKTEDINTKKSASRTPDSARTDEINANTPTQSLPRRFIADLRSVSQKAQIRLSPEMKHTICKNCDTLLVDGSTCTNEVENRSREAKKPWADVLLRKCKTCGSETRFPLTAQRQKRRPQRASKVQV